MPEINSPLAVARFGAIALGQQAGMRFGNAVASPMLPHPNPRLSARTSHTRRALSEIPEASEKNLENYRKLGGENG